MKVAVAPGQCTNIPFFGGGGTPFQGYRKNVDVQQVGVSAMHVPSGLWAYGYYGQEDNKGTRFVGPASDANNPNSWFMKAGIRRTWLPLGATVIWGEGGEYFNQFTGLCGRPNANATCVASINTSPFDANGDRHIGACECQWLNGRPMGSRDFARDRTRQPRVSRIYFSVGSTSSSIWTRLLWEPQKRPRQTLTI